MQDFSKIDVYALGVFLINLLTLDYAFENSVEDNKTYESFMETPSKFFEAHQVEFHNEEELNLLCELLQKMLAFDLTERISIFDV
jgi:serine/threonine protein kinase